MSEACIGKRQRERVRLAPFDGPGAAKRSRVIDHRLVEIAGGDRNLGWERRGKQPRDDTGARGDLEHASRRNPADSVGDVLRIGRENHRHSFGTSLDWKVTPYDRLSFGFQTTFTSVQSTGCRDVAW